MNSQNSHWTYKDNPLTEIPLGIFGFVYKITNLENGKMYIGRKYVQSTTRKPLTKKQKEVGRVKRTVVKKESNWRDYTGSCKPLNEDIKLLGKDKFKFEIIAFGETKGVVNYLEYYYQYLHHVLISENYYNDVVGTRDFIALKGNKELRKILNVYI